MIPQAVIDFAPSLSSCEPCGPALCGLLLAAALLAKLVYARCCWRSGPSEPGGF